MKQKAGKVMARNYKEREKRFEGVRADGLDPYETLSAAVMARAIKDYIQALVMLDTIEEEYEINECKRQISELERFFEGNPYQALINVDGTAFISSCRKSTEKIVNLIENEYKNGGFDDKKIKCPLCGNKIYIRKKMLNSFIFEWRLKCNHCDWSINKRGVYQTDEKY